MLTPKISIVRKTLNNVQRFPQLPPENCRENNAKKNAEKFKKVKFTFSPLMSSGRLLVFIVSEGVRIVKIDVWHASRIPRVLLHWPHCCTREPNSMDPPISSIRVAVQPQQRPAWDGVGVGGAGDGLDGGEHNALPHNVLGILGGLRRWGLLAERERG